MARRISRLVPTNRTECARSPDEHTMECLSDVSQGTYVKLIVDFDYPHNHRLAKRAPIIQVFHSRTVGRWEFLFPLRDKRAADPSPAWICVLSGPSLRAYPGPVWIKLVRSRHQKGASSPCLVPQRFCALVSMYVNGSSSYLRYIQSCTQRSLALLRLHAAQPKPFECLRTEPGE